MVFRRGTCVVLSKYFVIFKLQCNLRTRVAFTAFMVAAPHLIGKSTLKGKLHLWKVEVEPTDRLTNGAQ